MNSLLTYINRRVKQQEKHLDVKVNYTDEEVEKLINDYWDDSCSDEANVNEIVLQHQYNIS